MEIRVCDTWEIFLENIYVFAVKYKEEKEEATWKSENIIEDFDWSNSREIFKGKEIFLEDLNVIFGRKWWSKSTFIYGISAITFPRIFVAEIGEANQNLFMEFRQFLSPKIFLAEINEENQKILI